MKEKQRTRNERHTNTHTHTVGSKTHITNPNNPRRIRVKHAIEIGV